MWLLFLLLFQGMGSAQCGYFRRNKSSSAKFIVAPLMHLHILKLATSSQQKIGVLALCSNAIPSSLSEWGELFLCLTDNLRMPRFMYYDWPSSYTSAFLTDKWHIPFYVLWLAMRARHLTSPILRTLLDLLDAVQPYVLLRHSVTLKKLVHRSFQCLLGISVTTRNFHQRSSSYREIYSDHPTDSWCCSCYFKV